MEIQPVVVFTAVLILVWSFFSPCFVSVPVIPVAGLTSLEGHFSAPYGGICISFGEHMDEIIEFHEQDMDIVVQPGVGWETLNAFLKPHGMFFPLDPGPG